MQGRADPLAIELIKYFEGCRLDAYQDSVGVWTIGYGHTAGAFKGDSISQSDADRLLGLDLAHAEAAVLQLTLPLQLTDCELAALMSFVFNIGSEALRTSTLLRRLRSGEASVYGSNTDFRGPVSEFLKWNHAGGKVLDGLTKRRLAEAQLFCGHAWRVDP